MQTYMNPLKLKAQSHTPFPFCPSNVGLREWMSHEVKNTETMVGIALKYDLTVEDIRRSNNLWTNDSLWPGQV